MFKILYIVRTFFVTMHDIYIPRCMYTMHIRQGNVDTPSLFLLNMMTDLLVRYHCDGFVQATQKGYIWTRKAQKKKK